MTTTAQTEFQKALAELTRAERKVADLAHALPAIPVDFEGEAQIVEHGYSRYEKLTVEIHGGDYGTGQAFHGTTDGWDSMSEEGVAEHVIIDGMPYASPDDLEWD
jgi:hypothetical protein